MPPKNRFKILRNGLEILKKRFRDRKESILARSRRGEPTTALEDEFAEKAVDSLLDQLQNSGGIHPKNCLALEDILNPADECILVDSTKD